VGIVGGFVTHTRLQSTRCIATTRIVHHIKKQRELTMKLLGSTPPTEPRTSEGTLITELPKRQREVEKVTSNDGTGQWYNGRVLFISNYEVVIVPCRCRASSVHGAASRMPRVAKTGLPKMVRKGKEKRITRVLVEVLEHGGKI
jgi:hypothetical protein